MRPSIIPDPRQQVVDQVTPPDDSFQIWPYGYVEQLLCCQFWALIRIWCEPIRMHTCRVDLIIHMHALHSWIRFIKVMSNHWILFGWPSLKSNVSHRRNSVEASILRCHTMRRIEIGWISSISCFTHQSSPRLLSCPVFMLRPTLAMTTSELSWCNKKAN